MATIDLRPPLSVRLAYQHSQMATGTYVQDGSQVFSHLVTPPTSGVAAEDASVEAAQDLGTALALEDNQARLNDYQQYDGMRNTADLASGNYFPA